MNAQIIFDVIISGVVSLLFTMIVRVAADVRNIQERLRRKDERISPLQYRATRRDNRA